MLATGNGFLPVGFTLVAHPANVLDDEHRRLLRVVYEAFCAALRTLGVHVEIGTFGARMRLELVNDGPVTIVLDA